MTEQYSLWEATFISAYNVRDTAIIRAVSLQDALVAWQTWRANCQGPAKLTTIELLAGEDVIFIDTEKQVKGD